jgi:hypothetical protein
MKERNVRHKYTKLRTPKTNGKVENAHWSYEKELFQKNISTDNKLKDKINPVNQQEVPMKKIA